MQGFEGRVLLNRYQVEEFLGRGGMSDVYRVYDQVMNVPLAMKVLHEDLADDPVIMRSFEREAIALKKLGHPNIVPFYGIEKTQDAVFLLVHYIDGPTLKKILANRNGQPMPVMEALTYLRAVSAALGYAHKIGVVHCDMKPGNVMVDRGGDIYLTDFGIARHAESSRTSLGGAVGTAYYMAPEQFTEEVVTPATDVYALGIFLYELLTGRRPFQGDGGSTSSQGSTRHQRIMHAHLKLAPPDPRSINPNIPAALVQVILKAMQKNPRDRYSSAQEFYLAACAAVGVSPEAVPHRVSLPDRYSKIPPPPPPPPGSGPVPGAKKSKTGMYVLIAGGILALLAVIFFATRPRTNPLPTTGPVAEQPANPQPTIPSPVETEVVAVEPTLPPTSRPTEIPTEPPPPTTPPTSVPPTLPPTSPPIFCYSSQCGSYDSCLREGIDAYVVRRTALYSIPRYKPAEDKNIEGPEYEILEPGTKVHIESRTFDQCYANSHYWFVELDSGERGFVLEYYKPHQKDFEIPSYFPQLVEGYYLSPSPP